MYAPSLHYSLLSVAMLTGKGMEVYFKRNNVSILRTKNLCATGYRKGSLFTLDNTVPLSGVREATLIAGGDIWHARMGHVHHNAILHMAEKNVVNGLSLSMNSCTKQCESCTYEKLSRLPIPSAASKSECAILESVHSDVCSPVEFISKGEARYFVTYIDGASRWVQAYPISTKSEVSDCFQRFQCCSERKTGKRMKAPQSDCEKEYLSSTFSTFLRKKSIPARCSCA